MDRSEIIKKAVSKMEGPFTQVCEKVYGLLKGLGFVIQEESWRRIADVIVKGMHNAFEIGMNTYADCVEETIKNYRYSMYYAQDISHRTNAKRCLLQAKEMKRLSNEAFGKYLMEFNNEKKAELFKEHSNCERHHLKWLELAEHYRAILRSHGLKW
jgi:hypothetical protein